MTQAPERTAHDVDEVLNGIKIIDCDAHFTEPHDLWLSRTPKSRHSEIPVIKTIDGESHWYLGDELWATMGGNVIGHGNERAYGRYILQPFDRVSSAAWSVPDRVALLDELGIHAQICYPNALGFSSNHIFAIDDIAQRLFILQTYNDFLADIQEESGGRLLPQAVLPVWDMDATVAEMTRLADRGITGYTLSDKPEMLGLPELPDKYFVPMFELANDTKAVINFHIGSGKTKAEREEARATLLSPEGGPGAGAEAKPASDGVGTGSAWKSLSSKQRHVVTAALAEMSNVRAVCNLVVSGFFDRYPDLKIVSAESGIGWVPFILEALEHNFNEMLVDESGRDLQRRPTEYFRDHLFVTFWFESSAPRYLVDSIGVNNILVETDIPHPSCLYPGVREHFANVLGDQSFEVRKRILQDNAAELYTIDLGSS
ncbi:amidohydrolase family protein [Pseudonocardia ailaonensis]|uniref:Amidohydrolase family protein n=1 Tax=Pseudonocardia ailaonensis TaxID=367279 RepID=A0ABN2N821_9PSEU